MSHEALWDLRPKKLRVAPASTVVRATECLDSKQVQVLQEGEIVEQVLPVLVLIKNFSELTVTD